MYAAFGGRHDTSRLFARFQACASFPPALSFDAPLLFRILPRRGKMIALSAPYILLIKSALLPTHKPSPQKATPQNRSITAPHSTQIHEKTPPSPIYARQGGGVYFQVFSLCASAGETGTADTEGFPYSTRRHNCTFSPCIFTGEISTATYAQTITAKSTAPEQKRQRSQHSGTRRDPSGSDLWPDGSGCIEMLSIRTNVQTRSALKR